MSKKYVLLVVVSIFFLSMVFASVVAAAPGGLYPWGATIPRVANGWTLSPAGRQVALISSDGSVWADRPYGMAMSPDGKWILISNDGDSTESLMLVNAQSGSVVQTIPYTYPEGLFIGVAFSPDETMAYASAGNNNVIRVYTFNPSPADGVSYLSETSDIAVPNATLPGGTTAKPFPAGLTVSPDGKTLYVADNTSASVSVISLMYGKQVATVSLATQPFTNTYPNVNPYPYTVTLSKDGSTAYVSNWAINAVSVINTVYGSATYGTVTGTITVGTHPSAMELNPNRNELYVTNSDNDTISVINTTTNQVIRTIDVSPYTGSPEGSSPNALAVSPDGKTLYVVNAGNNDVDVIRLADTNPKGWLGGLVGSWLGNDKDSILGMIPTAWYPTGIEVSLDGEQLFVANAKGYGGGPNDAGIGTNPTTVPRYPIPGATGHGPLPTNSTYSYGTDNQYSGSMIVGTLSIINTPDSSKLSDYSNQVIVNNGFDERDKVRFADVNSLNIVPSHVGEPSPIKHVIYIIKENRTFDQVLGDLGKGNGDPNDELFTTASAPNQHALANQFVTLDNFYVDAEVSADGWNWSTAAEENTYTAKTWPAEYGGRRSPYDFEGTNFATAPQANVNDAYLWTRLNDAGVSFRNYGFFTTTSGSESGTITNIITPLQPELDANSDQNYPGFDLKVSDQTRYKAWLTEWNNYMANGNLPTVELVRLPNDHTETTSTGYPTPLAYMADNDYALGQIVQTVSHSPYWKNTAIFVIEDDSQDGPDHVDCHRTIAQCISPYTQYGNVDSTFYTTSSMLRTIELIAGIGPLTQFDASATPMYACFSSKPNLTPYTASVPSVPWAFDPAGYPVNGTAQSAIELAADKMDFSDADLIDMQTANLATWESIKGADSVMPAPIFNYHCNQPQPTQAVVQAATPAASSASSSSGDDDDD